MKTTDLIPLILYQLQDGDKYGYEIVQQIELASNGDIVIKQPTLYSVLKKLEQGRFITSYWQDSEIGGKRHYYKLTDNGREQLSTYPSFEQLIADNNEPSIVIPTISEPKASSISFDDIFADSTSATKEVVALKDELNTVNTVDNEQDTIINEDIAIENDFDISVDNIEAETPAYSPIDLTSSFAPTEINISNNINDEIAENNEYIIDKDNLTNSITEEVEKPEEVTEINITETPNINVSSENVTTNTINIFDVIDNPTNEVNEVINQFAENEKVSKFTEVQTPTQKIQPEIKKNKLKNKIAPSNKELFTTPIPENKEVENNKPENSNAIDKQNIQRYDQTTKVKYLDYIDFKTNPDSMKRHKAIKLRLIKMSLTCLVLVGMLVSTFALANTQGFSRIYCISIILAGTLLIFYPAILLFNIPKLKLKYSDTLFRYHIIRDLLFKLFLTLVSVGLIILYNLKVLDDFNLIFKFNNFTNLFTPIILSSIFIFDYVFSYIIYRKYTK